jgi:Mg-chelatase subunit ChlD
MRSTITVCFAAMLVVFSAFDVAGQAGRGAPKSGEARKTADEAQRRDESQEAIKIETTLVTVPVIVSDRNDLYLPDLKQEEFTLYEDGIKQEIVFFAAVKEPFHVVLMLDTSASTQEKLGQIQRAATAFVAQLQPADRVKVISFDDQIRELSEFTGDRAALQRAIEATRPGQGTKLYDAMRLALGNLERIKGRKAIVIFTDGVDWHSDTTRYDDNIRALEEAGVIIYPIRYDTRLEVEQMMREQQQAGQTVDLGVIFGGPSSRTPGGTTPPTVPGGSPVPTGRPGGQQDPYRLPVPPIVIAQPPIGRSPGGSRYPDDRYPDPRYPDSRSPDTRYPDRRNDPLPTPRGRRDDTTSITLDGMYRTADRYLEDLAARSGGKLHRADTLGSLPVAFAQIAAELRNQYSLGYYPANAARNGKYRKIQVKTSRKGAVVRARPGYRAPSGSA